MQRGQFPIQQKSNMKKIKLNLGCGQKYLIGYINCDYSKNLKKDKFIDLNKFPYPFKDNYADEILMDNVLEHLDDIPSIMMELYRILKKDGILKIIVPYAKSDWAFQDPTHKHFFTEKSMDYFTDKGFYTEFKFILLKADLRCDKENIKQRLRAYIPFRNILRYFFFNLYDGVYFELKKI